MSHHRASRRRRHRSSDYQVADDTGDGPAPSSAGSRVRSGDIDDEVNSMYGRLIDASRFQRPEPGERAVVAVVSGRRFAGELEGAVRSTSCPSRTERLFQRCGFNQECRLPPCVTDKSWNVDVVFNQPRAVPPNSPLIEVATDDNLQDVLDDLLNSETGCVELVMIVHSSVGYISFDVPGNIDRLSVHQSPRVVGAVTNSLITGASTFAGTRLDEIDETFPKKFFLGMEGIALHIDPSRRHSVFASRGNWSSGLSSSYLNDLGDALRDTQGYTNEAQWWDKWKGTAASVLGIAAGSAKCAFAVNANAGGIFFRHTATTAFAKHVTEFGAFKAGFSTVATAAGPAILVGCTVAAAVYFIPWGSFFQWLSGVLGQCVEACRKAWSWFANWLSEFKVWLEQRFGSGYRPMKMTV